MLTLIGFLPRPDLLRIRKEAPEEIRDSAAAAAAEGLVQSERESGRINLAVEPAAAAAAGWAAACEEAGSTHSGIDAAPAAEAGLPAETGEAPAAVAADSELTAAAAGASETGGRTATNRGRASAIAAKYLRHSE